MGNKKRCPSHKRSPRAKGRRIWKMIKLKLMQQAALKEANNELQIKIEVDTEETKLVGVDIKEDPDAAPINFISIPSNAKQVNSDFDCARVQLKQNADVPDYVSVNVKTELITKEYPVNGESGLSCEEESDPLRDEECDPLRDEERAPLREESSLDTYSNNSVQIIADPGLELLEIQGNTDGICVSEVAELHKQMMKHNLEFVLMQNKHKRELEQIRLEKEKVVLKFVNFKKMHKFRMSRLKERLDFFKDN